MKAWLTLLALVLLAPSGQAVEPEREHVHDRYEIILTADVALGFGADIQQLGWICDVTYDPSLPDSDEFNQTDQVDAFVAINCSGPGTVLFSQGTPATIQVATYQASDACNVTTAFLNTGASSTTRFVRGGYLLSFDEDSADQDKCSVQFEVIQADTGEEWQLTIPVVIYNDDAKPEGGSITGYWLPLLVIIAMLLLALWLGWDWVLIFGLAALASHVLVAEPFFDLPKLFFWFAISVGLHFWDKQRRGTDK